MTTTVTRPFEPVADADTCRAQETPRKDPDPLSATEEGPIEDEEVKDDRRLRPSPPTD